MSIRYANINPGDTFFRRPLIVAEGFDAGHIITPEQRFGSNNIDDFIDDALDDGSTLNNLLAENTLEYDIIYIDYNNGTDDIRRNAMLVQEVIRYVNTRKVTVGGVFQPNVVVGLSMGGLCARWGLRDMEINSENHQTRLFVSYDTPHQGANVPEGYQRLARHIRDLYVSTGGTAVAAEILVPAFANGLHPRQILDIANRPASKQMLINRVGNLNNINNTDHEDWQEELQEMGYPQGVAGIPFRNVAISNGSECAKPQDFNPGDNLFTFQATAGMPNIVMELSTVATVPLIGSLLHRPLVVALGVLPGRSRFEMDFQVNAKAIAGTGNQIYKGFLKYHKNVLGIPLSTTITNKSKNADAATLPYDYYPGGFIPIPIDLQSTSGPGGVAALFVRYDITVFAEPAFCFIPTPSALDIGQGAVPITHADYLTPYSGANPPIAPKATSFLNFITAFNGNPDNEQHTQIFHRNGNWLAQELNGTGTAPVNCAFACNGGTISGDANFCTTSGNYTIPNLPAGATVTWSASIPRAVTINTPNATQTTLTKVNNGPITLFATISSDCGANVVIQKEIYVGPEPVNILGAFDPTYHTIMGEVCVGDPYYFVAGDPVSSNPLNTYTWTHFPPPGSPNSISLYSGANLNITFIEPGMHTLRVTKTNPCGEVITNRVIEVLECFNFMFYSISPNPASSAINIGVNNKNTSQNRKVEPGSLNIDEVKIYDASGFLRLQQKGNKQPSVTINTSALTNGLYRVEISHAGKVERQQLLITR